MRVSDFQNAMKRPGQKWQRKARENSKAMTAQWDHHAGNTLLSLLICQYGFFVQLTLLRLIVFIKFGETRSVTLLKKLHVQYITFKKHFRKPKEKRLLFMKRKFMNKHPTGDI